MITWITAHLLLAKIIAGVAGALLLTGTLWFVYQRQITKAVERGRAEGQIELFKEQAADIEKMRVEAQAGIDKQNADLSVREEELTSQRAAFAEETRIQHNALSAQQRQINATISQGLGVRVGQETGLRNEIQSVSDANANSRLRLALSRTRVAEQQRPAQ